MQSLSGKLLVSVPELPDVFEQSVVLLVRHNDEGAFGLILNRPTDTRVSEVWHKVSQRPCRNQGWLHVGGPVEGPLMALHGDQDLAEISVLPGIYFAANREQLEELATQPDVLARYFVGYAGWGAGQLESELERGSWKLLPAKQEHVFESDERLWERACRELNDQVLRHQLGVKHMPPDVRMN